MISREVGKVGSPKSRESPKVGKTKFDALKLVHNLSKN